MKRLIAVAALAALSVPGCAQARTRLSGAGATFPSPFYQRTFADYYKETRTQVNYQATGSGAGVRQFLAGTTDFGATDKAVKDSHLKEGDRGLVQIPVVGGAIVPAYNYDCDLKLKQKQLADVYLGKITDWKDLGCAAGKIVPVFRSDGSGTTAGFTNSLASFSPEWKKNVGTAKAVAWPTGIGNKGNAGVAGNIRTTPGSIGYVNQAFIGKEVKEAWIENKAGNFVKATAETSRAGLAQIELDDKLRGSNGNPDGENSYPIVSLTWILVEPGYKTEAIKPLLKYMLGDTAQEKADGLGYVPLPEELKEKALNAVDSL
jgi:phosphate transport system substrate-binding protein